VTGDWTDADGLYFADGWVKVAIECDRSRLEEAVRTVKRIERKLWTNGPGHRSLTRASGSAGSPGPLSPFLPERAKKLFPGLAQTV